MDAATPAPWISLQIGAREHFAVPRSLNQLGLLQALLTDTWVSPTSFRTRLFPGQRFQSRYHPQLQAASVATPKLGSLAFELVCRRPGFPKGWPRTIARNDWFQRWAVRQLRHPQQPALNVFSYSYSARSIFRLAHDRGYPCVLGQMDPGPEDPALEDERLVTSVIAATSFSLFLCISLRSSLGRTGMR